MNNFFERIEWHPGIGDPTLVGWLTVAVYFYAAWKSFQVYRHSTRIFDSPINKERYLWLFITTLMVLLGFNKQLDLQTFFTATARYLSVQQGWYEYRRLLQIIFIFVIFVVGFITTGALLVLYRRVIKRHVFAIVGVCLLAVFVLIRASSFHAMDIFINHKFLGLHFNWICEIGGILLIVFNARILLRARRPLIDIGEFQ